MTMKGRQKHADRLKILSGQGRLIKAVGRVLYVGADMIRAEAHRSISAGSVSGKKHKPSAQNTPPNRDTGVLQACSNVNVRLRSLSATSSSTIVCLLFVITYRYKSVKGLNSGVTILSPSE